MITDKYSAPIHNTNDPEAVLSVTSLNRLAKSLLEANFPAVLVEGEISNFTIPASGHWYLTLKDTSSQIRCAMFAGRNRSVHFRPTNGQQVLVRGRLSIYDPRGDYQMILDSMEEAGAGALRRAFEELKAKLQSEGLFEPGRKQAVHAGFRHIGIITSATGAAVRDIVSVFARRFPSIRLTLFPVSVQGAAAKEEIANAINLANRLRDKLQLEALIVGRGGGSLEDLQAFNEESVARAIFASELPITSAVGHEIDFTIADFVADLRAPTPSAAAELMSPSQQEYAETMQAYANAFRQVIGKILRGQDQRLNWLRQRLQRPDRRLQDRAQHIDNLDLRLRRAMQSNLQWRRHDLLAQRARLQQHTPLARIERLGERLTALKLRSNNRVRNIIQTLRSQAGELGRSLNAVSPLNTLSRGYSITYRGDGQVVTRAAAIQPGEQIRTRLQQGQLLSRVESVEQDSELDAVEPKSGH